MKPDPRLLQKAVRLLARRAHSRRQLQVKLRRSGPAAAVEAVLDRLDEIGYIDDAEFARQRSRMGRLRCWSNYRIEADLRKQGVAEGVFRPVLDALEDDHPESTALAELTRRWIDRKGRPRRATDLKKLFSACARAGYPRQLVREELEGLFEGLEWD